MLIVIIATGLLASIPLVVAAAVSNQLPLTASHQMWNAAYEAAQSGLNDYLQHLDADASYGQFSAANNPGNAAFSGWEQITGLSAPVECYEYTPTVLTGNDAGLVSLTVSGKATDTASCSGSRPGTAIRTFRYLLRPTTSLDTVFWTTYETLPSDQDPTCNNDKVFQPGNVNGNCTVAFGGNDVIDGPVYSSDAFYMCGSPVFWSTVTSGDSTFGSPWYSTQPGCPAAGGGTPVFDDGAAKQGTTAYSLPTSANVATAVSDAAANGCVITDSGGGTTTISLTVSGGTGTLAWSGGTLANNGSNHNACGSGSSGTVTYGHLVSPVFAVQGNVVISGTMTGDLTVIASGGTITVDGSLTYPQADIVNYGVDSTTSQPSVWTDPTDSLGLIATGDIDVSRNGNGPQCTGVNPPVDSCDFEQGAAGNGCGSASAPCGLEIDAAMLSTGGSFEVDNFNSGAYDGLLRIFGSLAQEQRGAVATGGASTATGYAKDYHYDESLQTLWPADFLPPTGAAWGPVQYAELPGGSGNEAVLGS